MTAIRHPGASRALHLERRLAMPRWRSLATALACTAALLTSACSTTSTERTYLPSGDVGFTVNCSGDSSDSSWAACYKQAGEACGAYGYDVVSKDGDSGAPAGGSLGGVLSSNVKNRSMLVHCKQ
jgi:hypothetical protein